MFRLWRWGRRNPRLLGRFLILFGVILAGFLSNHGFLPGAQGQWHDYLILEVVRNSVPRHGKIRRTYQLKTENDSTAVEVAPEFSHLFNQRLLLSQPRPTWVEVLSNTEAREGIIEADGLRLKDGRILLDPELVKRIRQPGELLGVALCSFIVIAGIALHFLPKRR